MRSIAKAAYQAVPFKTPVLELIRGICTPPPRLRHYLRPTGVIPIRVGGTTFKVNSSGERIEADLYWTGWGQGWEGISLQLWQRLVREAKTIFDVGAYTGLYSLGAKAINPNASVAAFEPLPRNFERLTTNVRINGFEIATERLAVSDRSGTSTFWDSGDVHAKSSSLDRGKLDRNVIPIEVRTTRLDEYCNQSSTLWPDLLKIDVELHEPSVFRGMGAILAEGKPTIIVEVLRHTVGDELLGIISGLGYEIYLVDEERGLIRSDNICPVSSTSYNVLLCQPHVGRRVGIADLEVSSS